MKIIHNILVPTDFSACAENAFQFSLRLADKWKSQIKLVHVVTPDYGVTDMPVIVDMSNMDKIGVAQQLLEDFRQAGVLKINQSFNITTELKVSSLPQTAISNMATEAEADMIVMGTKSDHSSWDFALGTNASSVVKLSDCHVLVVPEEAEFNDFTIVGYAADLHETDPYHLWKVCKMMEPFHSIIRCVHIEKTGAEEKTKLRIEELEDFFVNNAIALQMTFHTLKEESIESGLETFANEWDLELLVMPTQHRDLFGQMFHKSMTKQMALHSKVPLLVLK